MEMITPYDKLKVTTMTLVAVLTNSINIDLAFQLLPVCTVSGKKVYEKNKLPFINSPGAILSLRFRKKIRGIVRNNLVPFKNVVTMDICTSRKNISLKLSSTSAQICGASLKEDGIEAINHLFRHLRVIQGVINKIHTNYKNFTACCEWIKSITKGEKVQRVYSEQKNYSNISLNIRRTMDDFYVVKPVKTPESIDTDFANFLLSFCDEFLYHSLYCKKIDFILTIINSPGVHVIHEPIEIKTINEVMVNFNYSLGFEVNRSLLNELIDGRNGFMSRYNNALSTSVTIELPYESLENSAIKRRKNKVPHHTFLVYRSGSVTQSGPGGKEMERAYYLFMSLICELRPYIEYNGTKY